MSDGSLRYDAIFEGIFKSEVLLDYDISRITENKIRICLKYVLYTHSYTKSEKQYIIDFANNFMDGRNIRDGISKKRKCKHCKNMVIAKSFCEVCMRNYLTKKFDSWTSGNEEIDQLIQNFQKRSLNPRNIVEWIPYEKFSDIEYKTEGGYAKIYTANFKDGPYLKWNSKKLRLERSGDHPIVLKELRKTNAR
ncbi:14052_t:CDS:1, partial [Entrophospora sp. SA101]